MSEEREKKSGGDKGNLTDDNIVQHLLNAIAKNPKRIRTALMDSSSQNMEKPPSHTYSSESGSSEASDKRHKISFSEKRMGNSQTRERMHGMQRDDSHRFFDRGYEDKRFHGQYFNNANRARQDIVIPYHEYLKLQARNSDVHDPNQFLGYKELPYNNNPRFDYRSSGYAQRPYAYDNGRFNRFAHPGSFNKDHGHRRPNSSYGGNRRRDREVYWVSLKKRTMIRNRVKLSLGVESLQLVGEDVYSEYLEVSNGMIMNPIRSNYIVDNITDYIHNFVKNPEVSLPSVADVISHLLKLHDQIAHYINFKALVSSVRDLCYKCKYNVCEIREVRCGTPVFNRNWYSSIVNQYNPNNYHHVNIKNILAETGKAVYEDFMSENVDLTPRKDTLDFSRRNTNFNNFVGHACGGTVKALTGEAMPKTRITDGNKSVKALTSCGVAESNAMIVEPKVSSTVADPVPENVFEGEKIAIEKAYKNIIAVITGFNFKFEMYTPPVDNFLEFCQSIYHETATSEDEFNAANFQENLDIADMDMNFLTSQHDYLLQVLKQVLTEKKQKLLSEVEDILFKFNQGKLEKEDVPSVSSNIRVQELNAFYADIKKFLEFLPSCVEFVLPFEYDSKADEKEAYNSDADKWCHCPFSSKLKWRNYCGVVAGETCRYNSAMSRNLMVKHLLDEQHQCDYHKCCLYFLKYKYDLRSDDHYRQVSKGKSINVTR